MNCPFCSSKARGNGARETLKGIKKRFLCKNCMAEGSQYTFYSTEEREAALTAKIIRAIELKDKEIELGVDTEIPCARLLRSISEKDYFAVLDRE
jgi:transposase-like protein